MGNKIRLNPAALADLQEIKDYIAQDHPEAALNIIRAIVSKYECLAECPEMGAPLAKKLRSNFPQVKLKSNYRYLVCGQYLIFYVYEEEVVSVQRILPTRRNMLTLFGDE